MQRDCQVRGLSKDDAMVRGRWRKMIRMVDEQRGVSGWMFLLVPAHPGSPGERAIKWSCVCVCFVAVFGQREGYLLRPCPCLSNSRKEGFFNRNCANYSF